jgi:hypothetical protein
LYSLNYFFHLPKPRVSDIKDQNPESKIPNVEDEVTKHPLDENGGGGFDLGWLLAFPLLTFWLLLCPISLLVILGQSIHFEFVLVLGFDPTGVLGFDFKFATVADIVFTDTTIHHCFHCHCYGTAHRCQKHVLRCGSDYKEKKLPINQNQFCKKINKSLQLTEEPNWLAG